MGEGSKTCPRCKAVLSIDARVCRVCSKQFPPQLPAAGIGFFRADRPNNTNFLIGLVVFAFVMTAANWLPANNSEEPTRAAIKASPTSPYADPDQQWLWINNSKAAVRHRLKDPDSAQFRNVHFYSGSGAPIACGEVNARNGFGGYSGFNRFIAKGASKPAELETDMASPAQMTNAWKQLCVKAPGDSQ